ncbi:MAG: hypothetical protein FWC56_02110 [Phycisphaerae bacterium]|nr:hypothetical protein [Phycisphaerae bacterium]
MESTDSSIAPLTPAALAPATLELTDSGLLCLTCEYNLTGTIAAAEAGKGENRCPECGTAFDPQELREYYADKSISIEIWDDDTRNIITRYIKMCLIAWFTPWRLPGMIPLFYREQSVQVFRRISICLPFGILALPITMFILPFMGFDIFSFFLIGLLGALVSIALCERLIGLVLANVLITKSDRTMRRMTLKPGMNSRWPGVVGFCRSFVLLGFACLLLIIVLGFSGVELGDDVIPLAWGGVIFWWWAALSSAVAQAQVSWTRRIVCSLLIPIIAAAIIALYSSAMGIISSNIRGWS